MAKEKWRTYRYPARFGWLFEFRKESSQRHPESVEVSNLYTLVFVLVFVVILAIGLFNHFN